MLLTWARDVYRSSEREGVRRALDCIASPVFSSGFASAGVYVFFDPEHHDVLYIGLARDLSERFAQHNSLVKMSATGCKRQQVRDWFASRDELGFAVMLQSSFSQVSVARQRGTRAAAVYDEESPSFAEYDSEGLDNIKMVEGQLIEAHVQRHGRRPPWNKVKGSRHGGERATPGAYAQLQLVTGQLDSLLLSRRTIRQLADDDSSLDYEEALHLARWAAVEATGGSGIDTEIIWDALRAKVDDPLYAGTGLLETVERLVADGYHLLPPPPPASAATPGSLSQVLGLTEGPPAPGTFRLRITAEPLEANEP